MYINFIKLLIIELNIYLYVQNILKAADERADSNSQ